MARIQKRADFPILLSTFLVACALAGAPASYGQGQAAPCIGTPAPGMGMPPPFRSNRPPLERALHVRSRWWDNPDYVSKLGLTPDQQKRMDAIFQQSRLNLIDLVAAVQKQEAIMDPLVSADQPDEAKIIAQIDRVAQARADLEKANARMLLGLRRVLTPEQWKKLKAEDLERHRGDFGPPRGRPPHD